MPERTSGKSKVFRFYLCVNANSLKLKKKKKSGTSDRWSQVLCSRDEGCPVPGRVWESILDVWRERRGWMRISKWDWKGRRRATPAKWQTRPRAQGEKGLCLVTRCQQLKKEKSHLFHWIYLRLRLSASLRLNWFHLTHASFTTDCVQGSVF